jgi:hypothetical protein
MINLLVVSILVLLLVVIVIWFFIPKVRTHAERPKHELLHRILRFEDEHPRREVVDPHRAAARDARDETH